MSEPTPARGTLLQRAAALPGAPYLVNFLALCLGAVLLGIATHLGVTPGMVMDLMQVTRVPVVEAPPEPAPTVEPPSPPSQAEPEPAVEVPADVLVP